jgi:cytosine deaminase
MFPSTSNYPLKNACVPLSLLDTQSIALKPDTIPIRQTGEGLCLVDLEIAAGAIAQIIPASTELSSSKGDIPVIDLRGG